MPRIISVINEADGSEMVLIPGGEFIMGEERTVVNVNAFYIDMFPIINSQYKNFIEITGTR
jgi:serine/threonine-protein kinase